MECRPLRGGKVRACCSLLWQSIPSTPCGVVCKAEKNCEIEDLSSKLMFACRVRHSDAACYGVCMSSSRIFFAFLFSHTCTFQFLDKPWSQVLSLLPPGSCLQCLSRIGFSNPTARRLFVECVAKSRSRAFLKSICAQEKVLANLYEYALGGARTH